MSTIALPHEPFTFASLPSLGWTERDLRRALERGEVRRVLRGVYVASCREDTVQLRTAALRLLVGPHQVVVDRTAAWLHGIDAYAAAELEDGSPIETCALRGHTRSRIAGVRGRTRDLAPGDILEAITGAFQEEEGDEKAYVTREDGSFLVSGWMQADEFQAHIGVPVPKDAKFETVAGYVLAELNHLPQVGEVFERGQWRFEVMDLDGRRIDKVLVTRLG